MKNKKKIIIALICIVAIVAIVIIVCVILLKSKDKNNSKIQERGYYSYFNEKGIIKINIDDYVKLPNDYQHYQANSSEAKIEEIINNSEIEVPDELLKTYKDDVEQMMRKSAEREQVDLETFIMDHYGITKFESYLNFYEEDYKYTIKKDLIYQALAKDLNIKIKEKDVKEYFKEALNSGSTYDELKDNFGEKLMYLYTIDNAVNRKLEK